MGLRQIAWERTNVNKDGGFGITAQAILQHMGKLAVAIWNMRGIRCKSLENKKIKKIASVMLINTYFVMLIDTYFNKLSFISS